MPCGSRADQPPRSAATATNAQRSWPPWSNGATLVAIAIYILVEAYHRLREPPAVRGGVVMLIAFGGLGVNLLGLWILHAAKGKSLNVRGAWLHVLTDALGSVGAIVAGALIWAFGWRWADPAIPVLIALLD